MHVTSEHILDDGTTERRFTLDGIPGILWLPAKVPAPLIMAGHPGGLSGLYPRLAGRARAAAAGGFATATIELPGGGEREPLAEVDRARTDLRAALAAGDTVEDDIIDRLIGPLVEQAVPEFEAVIDALLDTADVCGPIGVSGGVTAIGVHLAATDPRIVALGLFAGSYLPRTTLAEAMRITTPIHMLLQWDDEGNDRARALELFDAFASPEKTLLANMGGHTGVPAHAGADAMRFFLRHLRPTESDLP